MANQKLLLAGIRAHEAVDTALEEKRKAEEEAFTLRVTAEFRERLIGIVGHDLRTPLNTMLIAASLLQSRAGLDDEDARLVNRIVLSGQRMMRQIAELVEFTRARLGGGFVLGLGPCDLSAVCEDVAEEIRILSTVPVRCLHEGNLAGTWDADRLAEALSNVAGNAVDHAAPGTSVLILTHAEDDVVVADVINQGNPIPPELLPHVFEAFRGGRAHGARGTHLGLGLFVAREIAHAHGGTLDVVSSAGGTMFSLRLPRHAAPESVGVS